MWDKQFAISMIKARLDRKDKKMFAKAILMLIAGFASYVCSIEANQCSWQMGMSNGMITNHQITASSHHHQVNKARLNSDSAWRAESDSEEWIRVDFQRVVYVSGITTKGRYGGDEAECVTRYMVSYGLEEEELQYVVDTENEENLVCHGNHNRDTPAFCVFTSPVRLRYIQIEPTHCKHRCSLRFELWGCEVSAAPTIPPLPPRPATYRPEYDVTTRRKIIIPRVTLPPPIVTLPPDPPPVVTTVKSRKTTYKEVEPATTASPWIRDRPTLHPVSSAKRDITSLPTQRIISKEIVPVGNVDASLYGHGANSAGNPEKQTGMPIGILVGAAACVFLIVILLIIASIWYRRRKRTSPDDDESKQVLQQIGPYEPSSPGQVNPSVPDKPVKQVQVLQQLGPYAETMPVQQSLESSSATQTPSVEGETALGNQPPKPSPVKGKGVQVLQQVGPYVPMAPVKQAPMPSSVNQAPKPSSVKGRGPQVLQQLQPYEPTASEPQGPKPTLVQGATAPVQPPPKPTSVKDASAPAQQPLKPSSVKGASATATGQQPPKPPAQKPLKPSSVKGATAPGQQPLKPSSVKGAIAPVQPPPKPSSVKGVTAPVQPPPKPSSIKGATAPVQKPPKPSPGKGVQVIGPYEPAMPKSTPKPSQTKGVGTAEEPHEPTPPQPIYAKAKPKRDNLNGHNNNLVKETKGPTQSGGQSDPDEINHKPSVLNRASYKIANLADWDQDHQYVIDI